MKKRKPQNSKKTQKKRLRTKTGVKAGGGPGDGLVEDSTPPPFTGSFPGVDID